MKRLNKSIFGRSTAFIIVLIMLITLITTAGFAAFSPSPPAAERADMLIGFNGSPNPGLVRAFGGEIYKEFKIVNVIAARMSSQAAEALSRNPSISYVELDEPMYAIAQEVLWGINRVFGAEEYSFRTWSSSRGLGIGVAVLDTGIAVHEDLPGGIGGTNTLVVGGLYNDGHGHGTHVAGTIAALDNEIGVVGVSPEVSLYAVKVLDDSGGGSTSSVIAGIEWAVKNNIPIINMSLSGGGTTSLKDACDIAYAKGVLLVAAADNSGNPAGRGDNVGYPAAYPSVIAVAASDSNDQRASFSSTGPAVELIAPGVGIKSTVPGGYATYNGTSMASPHVAGVAALVWAADPRLTNVQVRAILRDTAQNLNLPVNHQGFGLVRADLAVAKTLETAPPTVYYNLTMLVSPLDTGDVNGAGNYEEGNTVNISATAHPEYKFVGWTGDILTVADVNASSTTITMDKDKTVLANFEKKEDTVLPPALNVTVTTDRNSYVWNAWVDITATVLDEYNKPVEGVTVWVTISDPSLGIVASYNGITDIYGAAYFRYRIANRTTKGTYKVKAVASMEGVPDGINETTFEVTGR
jgi:uncharacterized repeat protein (TIGR02543 family)